MTPLRVPAYRRLLGAQFVSAVGSWLHAVVAPWLVLQGTGSATWTSLVTAALFVPALLLSPLSGWLAHRADRSRVIVLGHLAAAGVAGGLGMLSVQSRPAPLALLVGSLLLGVVTAVVQPSYQTLVPDVVGRDQVPAAVGLEAAVFNIAKVVGPVLAGMLVATQHEALAFSLNAVSFVAVAAAFASAGKFARDPGRDSPSAAPLAGQRHVRLLGSYALLGASVQAVLPVATRDDLHVGPQGYGVLVATFALGGVLALPLLPQLRRRLLQHDELPAAIAVMGAAQLMFAGSAAASWTVGAALALPAAGLAWVWAYGSVQSMLQMHAVSPGVALARFNRAGLGGMAIGSLLAGTATDLVGAAGVLAITGGALLALAQRTRHGALPDLGVRVAVRRFSASAP